jgi:hypothetical protein
MVRDTSGDHASLALLPVDSCWRDDFKNVECEIRDVAQDWQAASIAEACVGFGGRWLTLCRRNVQAIWADSRAFPKK